MDNRYYAAAQLGNQFKEMKKLLIQKTEKAHMLIFRHEMTDQMRHFLKNLLWSFLGGGLSAVSLMIMNIIAGRLIGPIEYGKYNLVITLNTLFLIPIFVGIDVPIIRQITSSKEARERRKIISSSFYFILFTSLILGLAALSVKLVLKSKLNIDFNILIIALLFTFFVAIKSVFDCYIRGMSLFKTQFKARLIELAVIVTGFILLFFIAKNYTFLSYLFALAGGAFALSIYYLIKINSFFENFDLKTIKHLLHFGKLYLVNNILATIFLASDKLIISKYLGMRELGIYGAYYAASYIIVTQVTQMFVNVFLPSIAANKDKWFVKKVDRLFTLLFFPTLIVLCLIILTVLKLFGDKYGVYFGLIFLFGLYATMQIASIVYNAVVITLSKKTYKKFLYFNNTLNLATLALYVPLIYFNLISISSVLGLLIINTAILIVIQRVTIYHYLKHENS